MSASTNVVPLGKPSLAKRGMLDLRITAEGTVRCTGCGWEGTPPATTHCPSCEPLPDNVVLLPVRKIARNAPCPCKSGRKWKKCCGA